MKTSNNDRCPFRTECERKCVYQMKELECDYYNANAMPGMEIEDQEKKQYQEEEQYGGYESYAEAEGTQINSLTMLPVDRLHPHPDNPRKDLGDLSELADSIKANGIFQNLTVVPDDTSSSITDFTVIIGHRRLAAAKKAGLQKVPCVITEISPNEQLQTMLMENMQRSDLTVYEQAQGFQMMLDLGSTVEEIAEKSGFSTTTVKRRVKMMELDQTKLKEVSSRQLSLTDFDTLAKIEDIKERNKVLESIGTRDFSMNVSSAMTKQKEKHNLPLVKAWLKEVGATEIKNSDTYGSQYEYYDGRYSISISKWNEDGNVPPEIGKTAVFYVMDTWGSLRLYKKAEKKKPEKKSPEEIARTKAINEAWDCLNATASAAYAIRKQFVEQLTFTEKNKADILYGALLAHLLEAIDYNSPDRSTMTKLLNLPDCYGSERSEKLAVAIENIQGKDLPVLVYAGFGDNEKQLCCGIGYKSYFPEYKKNAKLAAIYVWLARFGYEMSTEEIQFLNGEHAAYHAKEAYEEAEKNA